MAIELRWSGSHEQWVADIPDNDGKRKRQYFGTDKRSAQAKFHRALADYYASPRSEQKKQQSDKNSPLLSELAHKFLDWNKINKTHGT